MELEDILPPNLFTQQEYDDLAGCYIRSLDEVRKLRAQNIELLAIAKAAKGAYEEGLISCNMGYCYCCELKDALKELEKYEKENVTNENR